MNEKELKKIIRQEISKYLLEFLNDLNERHEKEFGKKLF